jgi:hypothetical protein
MYWFPLSTTSVKGRHSIPRCFLNDLSNDSLAFFLLLHRTSTLMLRKFAAALLLLLAASPFTAPFSTCDAATLFAGRTSLRLNHYHLAFTSSNEQSTTLAVSSTRRTRERRKLFVSAIIVPVHERSALTGDVDAVALAIAPARARSSPTPLRI